MELESLHKVMTIFSCRAEARVHLWIYQPEQLIKLVIDKPPMMVNQNKAEIVAELKNVTQEIVVVDDIR